MTHLLFDILRGVFEKMVERQRQGARGQMREIVGDGGRGRQRLPSAVHVLQHLLGVGLLIEQRVAQVLSDFGHLRWLRRSTHALRGLVIGRRRHPMRFVVDVHLMSTRRRRVRRNVRNVLAVYGVRVLSVQSVRHLIRLEGAVRPKLGHLRRRLLIEMRYVRMMIDAGIVAAIGSVLRRGKKLSVGFLRRKCELRLTKAAPWTMQTGECLEMALRKAENSYYRSLDSFHNNFENKESFAGKTRVNHFFICLESSLCQNMR